MAQAGPATANDLRDRVTRYLRAHHTMTIATVGPEAAVQGAVLADAPEGGGPAGNAPHAASVFYAMDDSLRLVFISKPSSLHGSHIGQSGPVAVTVSEDYGDWELIQGVQLWGEVRLLSGAAKAGALAMYLKRFPFVRDLLQQPRLAELIRNIGVYRVEPKRVAFTDNTTGVFGREALELVIE
ncbi:MAG: pyridoxamine 5'-phosphate oxidase family protein [bacterium]